MKLLFCPACNDIRAIDNLVTNGAICACGQSWAEYLSDGKTARYCGLAEPIMAATEVVQNIIVTRTSGDGKSRAEGMFAAWFPSDLWPGIIREGPGGAGLLGYRIHLPEQVYALDREFYTAINRLSLEAFYKLQERFGDAQGRVDRIRRFLIKAAEE